MQNNTPYHKEIALIYHNIQYYQKMMALSNDPYQRISYENLLNIERRRLNYFQWYYKQQNNQENQQNKSVLSRERRFTLEELAQYDGSGGRPSYVAVNGIVYDVSIEASWGGGTHFGLYAGKDFTAQFNKCHSGELEVLKNLPQVGVLMNE